MHCRTLISLSVSAKVILLGRPDLIQIRSCHLCPTPSTCLPGNDPLGNRPYRYEFLNNKLVNPKLLLDLPAKPIPIHNGGKIVIGPDNNVYLVVGDLNHKSITQNFANNPYSNGTGVIYRVTQEGEAVKDILGSKHPVNKYYAYEIRNSFGMDFDPITGILWDMENGPSFGDEINLIEPGFNSGWRKMQGIWETNGTEERGKLILNESSLAEKVALSPKFLQDWEKKENIVP
jgi:glucose/arabinose dehydrogenase